VLQKVSFRLGEGRLLGLLGRNGAGKSTCMNVTVGLLPPRTGAVEVFGTAVTTLPPEQIAARGVALVPQGRRIFKSLSVRENLVVAARKPDAGSRHAPWTIETVFGMFPRLSERRSAGEPVLRRRQQMLAIGRALMANPRVLLMDEPSEGLAPQIIADVGRTIARLKGEGLSIVLVEQNIKLTLELADDIAIINSGRVVFTGAASQIKINDPIVAQHWGCIEASGRSDPSHRRLGEFASLGRGVRPPFQVEQEEDIVAQWNKYEATAARRHGRPGREARPKSITIDVHSHVGVPRAAELVKPHLAPAWNPLVLFANAETKARNQKQEADIGARAGLEQRLADLDAMGVDMQVIKPPPPQCYYAVPVDIAVQAARIVNDGIAEFVARKPDRLKGFGTVPMPDGNEAAKELERCVTKLGFKGVQVLTNVNGKELSDPAFAPFWRKAEELGALVVIHPNGFTQAERLSRFYFNNVIGNPLETTIALHYLIFDGVLERHPNLKILAVHGGGYLASYSGRIDHAWGARSDSHGALPQTPTSYLKKIYFDTVVFTPHQLQELVRLYGAAKILMGTDYPFDMADFDPVGPAPV
jgi:aminocarboxymuconate-semialdehyde decarboxylase